jgi:ubiquitin-conjugating enzyme E2 variant
MGPVTRAIEALSIAAALGLLALNGIRLAGEPGWVSWRSVTALAAGAILADFGSGIVHWAADTWGRESLPIVGRRFLRPFRIHHVNPRDILRRDFVDLNGDVALLTCPIFAAAWAMPLSSEAGRLAALLLFACAAAALPTNQVHQWAHRPDPPALVAWLQRCGLILDRARHARHHTPPFVSNYCIATGWCNGLLDRLEVPGRLERRLRRGP